MGLTLDDAGLIRFHTLKYRYLILHVYYFSIVTLSGAHTLGHVHLKNSGYSVQEPPESIDVNAWDDSPTKFDSEYFRYLLDKVKQLLLLVISSYYNLSLFLSTIN